MDNHRRPSGARRTRGIVVAIITAATIAICAGTASAFWRTVGSGTGSVTTADSGTLVLTTTAVTPAGAVLYPGSPKAGLTLRIAPTTAPFRVTATARDSGRPVLTGVTGCPGTVISLDNAVTDVTVTTTAVTVTVPAVVSIAPDAPDACQGATFEIPVLLTGVLL